MLKKFSQFVFEKKDDQIRIFCDLDGVLVDFDRGFKALDSNEQNLSAEDYEKENGKNSIWPLIDKEGPAFWENLRWTKDGRELWDYLTQYSPVILSSPSRSHSSIEGKMAWIKRNLGLNQEKPTTSHKNWDPESRIILSPQKYLYARSANDVLIDDNKNKLQKWTEAGGTGILHNDSTDTIRLLEEILREK